MKMKNNDNDVYFLGNKQQNHLRKYAVAITFAVICALGIVYIFSIKSDVTYKQGLPTIETLPPNATSPKFKGRYDFTKFLEWVSKNLTYPTEHETENAKVVVSFVITKEGTVDHIKILSQPKQKAFAKEVVLLLQKCPKWAPGKLADGTPVNISYTLPIKFSNVKRFD